MEWVTRRHIRVNRTATAWLIRRFLDPGATFLFVDAEVVAQLQERDGARGFDAPGALYPHRDAHGRCSFEILAAEYRPDDAVLVELGRIVRGADFADEADVAPESPGLRLMSHGFPMVAGDDHEILDRAAFVYDALYAALEARRSATR